MFSFAIEDSFTSFPVFLLPWSTMLTCCIGSVAPPSRGVLLRYDGMGVILGQLWGWPGGTEPASVLSWCPPSDREDSVSYQPGRNKAATLQRLSDHLKTPPSLDPNTQTGLKACFSVGVWPWRYRKWVFSSKDSPNWLWKAIKERRLVGFWGLTEQKRTHAECSSGWPRRPRRRYWVTWSSLWRALSGFGRLVSGWWPRRAGAALQRGPGRGGGSTDPARTRSPLWSQSPEVSTLDALKPDVRHHFSVMHPNRVSLRANNVLLLAKPFFKKWFIQYKL